MKKINYQHKNLLFYFSLLFISLTISSCDDKCDELAKEFVGFSVSIRPSFVVEEYTDIGWSKMPNLNVEYEIFKMHCEGYTSDVFNQSGKTDYAGVLEIFQTFTCEIVTPEDFVVLLLYSGGNDIPFYELNLDHSTLREYAGGYFIERLHAEF